VPLVGKKVRSCQPVIEKLEGKFSGRPRRPAIQSAITSDRTGENPSDICSNDLCHCILPL
jgi:hypothetical protein